MGFPFVIFMKFNSEITIGDNKILTSEAQIKVEPMLHRANGIFAHQNGGEITRTFLHYLFCYWRTDNILIDSRVHMLMPGMYPCIPGWHHDDVPRERSDGQPNYDNPSYKAEHCMALFGDCSLTEFALGEHEIDIPPVGRKVYKELSPKIEQLCIEGKLNRFTAIPNKLIFFNWQTWHRGAETTKTGFRFFIRATKGSNLKPKNEIRYNANVYMPVLNEGW